MSDEEDFDYEYEEEDEALEEDEEIEDEEDFEEEDEDEAPTSADGGEFKIESDKPIPRATTRKYPFHKMSIGDSFEVRINEDVIAERGLATAVRLQRSALSSSASSFNKRNDDRRMVVRKTGPKTLRCWCVEP